MEKRATEFVGWRYIAQSIIHYTSSHLGWYCQRTEGSFFRTAPGWIRGRFLSYFAKELLFHWFSELNLCHQASHRKKPRHDTPSFAPCRKGKTKKKKKKNCGFWASPKAAPLDLLEVFLSIDLTLSLSIEFLHCTQLHFIVSDWTNDTDILGVRHVLCGITSKPHSETQLC